MTIRAHIALVLFAAACGPAWAQAGPPPSGIAETPDWTVSGASSKAAHRKGSAKAAATRATRPVPSPEDAEKAARLAERRAKFFAPKAEPKDSGKIPEFGGYNPDTMGDGSMRPGAMFKF